MRCKYKRYPYAPALWSCNLSEYGIENCSQSKDGKKKTLHIFIITKNYKGT